MKKTDLAALEKCKVFAGTDEALKAELLGSQKYEIKTYKKGETVFSPENFRKCLAVILKGRAEVWKLTEKGTLFMSELTGGNIFGMSNLFYDKEDFPTTVSAKENLRILFITKEQLNSLFFRYPVIFENYLNILSNKIHFLNEKIESISSTDAASALRAYLLDRAKKSGSDTFSLPVSYQKLSSILSIGRTSVYRAFDELTKEGFLKKNGKVITITERNEKK
ncbi:MAG: Crp/Fnr family transcriptional regulator [Clostridia bacterium]|nr:Crp/Fnr family transcriptional regulator [Clostridia bacterium]